MVASAAGNLASMQILLEKKASADSVDSDLRSALMYAAVASQPAALDLLLRCHARSNIRDKDGCSALMLACSTGDMDSVYVLLSYKCEVDSLDMNNQTAMFKAAAHVRRLAGGRAAPRSRCLLSPSAAASSAATLSAACASSNVQGHFMVMEMLLVENTDMTIRDLDGRTPLHLAAAAGHAAACALLLLFQARCECDATRHPQRRAIGSARGPRARRAHGLSHAAALACRGVEMRAGQRISTGGNLGKAIHDIHTAGVPQHIKMKVDQVLAARVSPAPAFPHGRSRRPGNA